MDTEATWRAKTTDARARWRELDAIGRSEERMYDRMTDDQARSWRASMNPETGRTRSREMHRLAGICTNYGQFPTLDPRNG